MYLEHSLLLPARQDLAYYLSSNVLECHFWTIARSSLINMKFWEKINLCNRTGPAKFHYNKYSISCINKDIVFGNIAKPNKISRANSRRAGSKKGCYK